MADLVLPAGRADEGRAVTFLSALPRDKAWRVTVTPWRKSRSEAQNRALFGLAYKVLAEHMGLRGHAEIEELHDTFCRLYFGEVEREIMGKVITRPKRTTTKDEHGKRNVLSTTEFCDFFAFVQQKAAGIGCFIEDPDSGQLS